jgi:hypothetical protein
MRFVVLLAALFLLTSPAMAKKNVSFSGAELLKMCSSTYDTDYGLCAGFVSGISNIMLDESVAGFRACNHATVKAQQAIEIFRGYSEIFPETLKEEANVAVAGSLARAFPCTD